MHSPSAALVESVKTTGLIATQLSCVAGGAVAPAAGQVHAGAA